MTGKDSGSRRKMSESGEALARDLFGFPKRPISEEDVKILRQMLSDQNRYLEDAAKRLENRTIGTLLEANMDVLREVTSTLSVATGVRIASLDYINEKLLKVQRELRQLSLEGYAV